MMRMASLPGPPWSSWPRKYTTRPALGAYLMAQGRMPPNGELLAHQGFEMGRGGQVKVRRNTNGKILIQGQAVAVLRGEIIRPEATA